MNFDIDEETRRCALSYARAVIARTFGGPEPREPSGGALDTVAGAFVSLHKRGALRGCIGRMSADVPLVRTIADMARAAAFEDPRFPPLRREELDELIIEITVLSPLHAIKDPQEIEIGRHGVQLTVGMRSAVFLPQVAPEQGWGVHELLDNLALKAGLPPSAWQRPDARLAVFEGVVFSEAR